MSAASSSLPMSSTGSALSTTHDQVTGARNGRLGHVVRGLLLALVLVFFLVPIVYLTLVSFTPQPEVLSGQIIPSRIAWENWPNAFDSVQVMLFLRNSITVAALSASVTMAIAVPELTFVTRKLVTDTFQYVQAWTTAGLLYLITTYAIAALLRFLERRIRWTV